MFHLLNLTFISFIQSVLLYLIAAPAYILLLASRFEPEVSPADFGAVGLQLWLIASEIWSDQTQWGESRITSVPVITQDANIHKDYQQAKKQYQKTAKVPSGYTQEEMDRGFVTRGLWAHSRHPNFAAEQTIWCLLYQWGCYATQSMYNWTMADRLRCSWSSRARLGSRS